MPLFLMVFLSLSLSTSLGIVPFGIDPLVAPSSGRQGSPSIQEKVKKPRFEKGDIREAWPDEVLFCSETIRSNDWQDLEDEKGKQEGLAWLKTIEPIDEFMGGRLRHVETAHFRLTYDIARYSFKKKKLDRTGGAYQFAIWLEDLYQKFCEDLGATDSDFFSKSHVFLWDRAGRQAKASLRFVRMESSTGSKLLGAAPVFSLFYDKSHFHEPFELHQGVIHNVTHCLISNVFDGLWPGKEKGGWLDAGLAHYYEIEYYGGVRHYCYREQDTMMKFKFGRWENFVKATLAKRKKDSILPTLVKATDQLSRDEHTLSWSLVEFILTEHPGKLGTVAKGVKAKKPLSAVFRAGLGMSTQETEEAWREYVSKNYGKKKR